jgi:cyclopropane-fatty-acyl-phospholipid synthase
LSTVARQLLSRLLEHLPGGALDIRHPDGTTQHFGRGDAYITIVIRHARAYRRLLGNPSLRLAEAYMDGDIDIEGDLTHLPRLATDASAPVAFLKMLRKLRGPLGAHRRHEARNIRHHYDIGNDFYAMWLDESMTYSCAYFQHESESLESAQRQKRAHIHRKLMLKPGQRVLEIGSGWGTALVEAAEKYDITGVGLTLSNEQLRRSRELAEQRGVADRIEFRLQNYREVTGEQFDAIYSIGMFEHIGRRKSKAYFDKLNELLVDGGVSVLHTITTQQAQGTQPFIAKHIFPGGYIPAGAGVVSDFATHGFRLTHSENLRRHYAATLDEWNRRFQCRREDIVAMFDERFARMWEYYLCGSAGAFRYGWLDLFQYTFTKGINNAMPLTNGFMYDQPMKVRIDDSAVFTPRSSSPTTSSPGSQRQTDEAERLIG